MPDFIPENHEQFRSKFTLFTEWMEANGATFGFTPTGITAIAMARADHGAKLTDKQAKDLAALAATLSPPGESHVRIPRDLLLKCLQEWGQSTHTCTARAGRILWVRLCRFGVRLPVVGRL